jgi:hypothetical protein
MNPYTKKRLIGILNILWGFLILIVFTIAGNALWEKYFGVVSFFLFIYIAIYDLGVQRIYCIPQGITSLLRSPKNFLIGKVRIITFDEMLSYQLFTKPGIKAKRAVRIWINRSAVGSIPVRLVLTEDHVDDFDAFIKHLESGGIHEGLVKRIDKNNTIRGPWQYVEPDPIFLKQGVGYETPQGQPIYEAEHFSKKSAMVGPLIFIPIWFFLGIPALYVGITNYIAPAILFGLVSTIALIPIFWMSAMRYRNNKFQIYVNGVKGLGLRRLYPVFIPFSKIKIEGITSFRQEKIPVLVIHEVDDRYSIFLGGRGTKVDESYNKVINSYSAWKEKSHLDIIDDRNLQPKEEKKYYGTTAKLEKPTLTVDFYITIILSIAFIVIPWLTIGFVSISLTLTLNMFSLIFLVIAERQYRSYKKQEYFPLSKK